MSTELVVVKGSGFDSGVCRRSWTLLSEISDGRVFTIFYWVTDVSGSVSYTVGGRDHGGRGKWLGAECAGTPGVIGCSSGLFTLVGTLDTLE